MINDKIIRELLIAKLENEQKKNEKIYSRFTDEDVDGILDLISKNEDIQLTDAIYKYMKESNAWICIYDENKAYREYGMLANRGVSTSLKKSDYTYYIKKDMVIFESFIKTMADKMNVEHKKKLLEVMESIMSDLGNENYEKVAYESIFKYC